MAIKMEPGVKFYHLTVVKRLERHGKFGWIYLFECDCGRKIRAIAQRVREGKKKYCSECAGMYRSIAIKKAIKKSPRFAEIKKRSDERKEKIMYLRNKGLSYEQLAERFGISKQRCYQIVTGKHKR